jgi:hypothetical protein
LYPFPDLIAALKAKRMMGMQKQADRMDITRNKTILITEVSNIIVCGSPLM